jgi:DNA-binding MurR/RpiR family transcriptional regulator
MKNGSTTKARTGFDAHVHASLTRLSPAEQRTARFFMNQKRAVLLGSAAQIAQKAGAATRP